MRVATAQAAVPWLSTPGSETEADNLRLVLSIEQGRELANLMTELPAPVGDGLVHSDGPICPQDPDTVHIGQSRSELVWLLDATMTMVEDLTRASIDLAGDRAVPGLVPVVAIAQRWAALSRSLLG